MKRIFIVILFITVLKRVSAQEIINPKLKEFVEVQTLKNIYLFKLKSRGSGLKNLLRTDKYWDYESETIKHSVPSFGFSVKPDIVISRFLKEYPDKSYKLYKIEIPRSSKINDSIFHRHSSMMGEYVIGINEQNKIKFIGGDFFRHHFAKDFKFKKNRPESYIFFLELFYYDMEHNGIRFVGRKDKHYIFEGESRDPLFLKFTIELDPENPERSKRDISYSENKNNWFELNKKPIRFSNKNQADNFLLGETMKNIYLYRLQTTKGLWDFLEPDSNYFKDDDTPIDHLIPDYNEKLEFGYEDHNWWPSKSFIALRVSKTNKDILSRPGGYKMPPASPGEDSSSIGIRWEKFYQPTSEQYFLAFMNLDDNLIYYMSGDYFLSKVLDMDKRYNSQGQHVYSQMYFPKNYLVDRLFRYQIFSIDALKQISEDDEKIIYEAESRLKVRKKLKITFDKKVPEDVLVEEY